MKNSEGHHEFKNPYFKRDDTSKILDIRRKQIDYDDRDNQEQGKTLKTKYEDLKKDYQESKNSLDMVASQNKRLMDANSELLNKLNQMNSGFKVRIKKVLFIFYVCSYYHDPVIEKELIDKLRTAGIKKIEENDMSDGDAITNRLSSVIKKLSDRLIYQNEGDDSILDEIIIFLKQYLVEKLKLKEIEINWKEMAKTLFTSDKSSFNINEYSNVSERIQIFIPDVLKDGRPFNGKLNRNDKSGISFAYFEGSIFNRSSLSRNREQINKSFEEDNNSETGSLKIKQISDSERDKDNMRF